MIKKIALLFCIISQMNIHSMTLQETDKEKKERIECEETKKRINIYLKNPYADPNDFIDAEKPLLHAICSFKSKPIKDLLVTLLQRGAIPALCDDKGRNALHICANNMEMDPSPTEMLIIEYTLPKQVITMLKERCKKDGTPRGAETPLEIAAHHAAYNEMDLYLRHGAKISLKCYTNILTDPISKKSERNCFAVLLARGLSKKDITLCFNHVISSYAGKKEKLSIFAEYYQIIVDSQLAFDIKEVCDSVRARDKIKEVWDHHEKNLIDFQQALDIKGACDATNARGKKKRVTNYLTLLPLKLVRRLQSFIIKGRIPIDPVSEIVTCGNCRQKAWSETIDTCKQCLRCRLKKQTKSCPSTQ